MGKILGRIKHKLLEIMPPTIFFLYIFLSSHCHTESNLSTVGLEMISKEIRKSEKEGDMMTRDIIKKLNKTFSLPIEHEDLHTLAIKVDDVVDMIWASVNKLTLFRLPFRRKMPSLWRTRS